MKYAIVTSQSFECQDLCSHCRNLTNDMIRKLAERGGVIGINYCASFLMDSDEKGQVRSQVAKMEDHIRYLANIGGMG